MKAPELTHKAKAYIFGVLIAIGGFVFGMSISLFNTFFDYFILGFDETIKSSKYDSIKTNLNFFYSLSFILSTCVSGWFLERFGRRALIISVGVINIILFGVEAIPCLPVLYAARFLSGNIQWVILGACTIFYTGLCPIMIREYLPVSIAGSFGSIFYLMISLGTNAAFFLNRPWMKTYYYVILWIPAGIVLFQLLCLVVFFNIESPSVVFLEVKMKLDHSMINDTFSNEDSSQIGITNSLLERSKKLQLRSRFFNDPRIVKYANCFYSKEKVTEYLSFAFDEFSSALLKTDGDNECVENRLGFIRLGWHKKYRKQFLICILLNFLNQATGINCLVMYSSNIFAQVGYVKQAALLTNVIGILLYTLIIVFVDINRTLF